MKGVGFWFIGGETPDWALLRRIPVETLGISDIRLSGLSDLGELPKLKELMIGLWEGADVDTVDREAVLRQFPSLELLVFHDGKGAEKALVLVKDTETLNAAVAGADKVVISTLDPCRDKVTDVALALDDPAEVASFTKMFRFTDNGSHGGCFCAGSLLIEWRRGEETLLETRLHHMKSLRCTKFTGDGFAQLTEDSERELRAWLAERGIECK